MTPSILKQRSFEPFCIWILSPVVTQFCFLFIALHSESHNVSGSNLALLFVYCTVITTTSPVVT